MSARDPVTVILMGDPVPFARMRTGNSGQHFVPQKQRNAAAAMRNAASDAMLENGNVMFDEPVSLTLRVELPIPQSWSKKKQQRALVGLIRPASRPDLDNLTKLCTDAFNSVLFRDDAQICVIHAVKTYGLTPKLIATIAPFKAEE